jgi:hypothetical protein
MLMVLARQPIEAQRLFDILFDPAGELGILG